MYKFLSYLILSYLILIGNIGLIAQNVTNNNSSDTIYNGLQGLSGYGNYNVTKRSALHYMATNPSDAKFRKNFGRWNWLWQSRCGSDGNTQTYATALFNYAKSSPQAICNEGGNWISEGVGRVLSNGVEWQNQGFISCVYTYPPQPNIIFAGARSGGIWKTKDNGQNWKCVTDDLRLPGMGISSIIGHPTNPDILYASTGYSGPFGHMFGVGILKSINGGESWAITNASWAAIWGGTISKMIMHPQNPDIMYALQGRSILKTTNGWATHTVFLADIRAISNTQDGNLIDIALLPANLNVIIVSADKDYPKEANVYKYDPSLTSPWQRITPLLNTNSDRYNIAVTNAAPNNVYLIFRSYPTIYSGTQNLELRVSNDGGATWPTTLNNKILPIADDGYLKFDFVPFKISSLNANVMYLGTKLMMSSHNGGRNFTHYNNTYNTIHDDTRAIQIYEESLDGLNDKLIIGTDGGVSKTVNNGITWQNINGASLSVAQFFDMSLSSLNPNKVIGGTQDDGTMIKEGSNWNHIFGGDGGATVVDWSDPNIIYSRSNPDILDENGWILFTFSNSSYTGHILRQDTKVPNRLYACLDLSGAGNYENKFYRFDRNASSFLVSEHNLNTMPQIDIISTVRDIQVAPSNSDIIYLGGVIESDPDPNSPYYGWRGGVFKSEDNGLSWTLVRRTWYGINCIVIDPKNPYKIWIGHDFHNENGNQRVFECENTNIANPIFTDITSSTNGNFPPFSVNTLIHQRGSNGVLYAGTDAGVFRFDPVTQKWECFSKNLPPCLISDLEIDYCKGKIYAATYGRGMWSADLAPTSEEIIAENTLLDEGSVTNAANDIIIRSGKRLTVKGRLNMATTKKIVVEIGAELVVEGGTISNYCGDMWQGIVVKGNVNADLAGFFPNRNQGYVNFYNANIENARTAVASESGGMITAFGTNFTNNVRDVSFVYYPFPQRSSFTRCNFKLNDQYRSTGIDARMSMWAVKGVSILGCSFENNTNNTNFDIFNPNVKGIYAIDAEFSVGAYCSAAVPYPLDCPAPNLVRSNFSKFRYAVRALMTNGNPTYWIDRTDFTDNQTGIYSQQVNNMTITRNTFNIDNKSTTEWHYGIVMETGTGFKLEENSFIGNNQPANTNYSVGLVIINLGSQDNVSYRNTYTKLRLGNIAEGFNNADNMLDYYGFQYLCNEQNNNDYDIFVASPPGIRHFQGKEINPLRLNEPPLSAQNTFSNNGGNREIDNYGRSIIYLADNTVPRSIPQSVRPGWVAVNTDQVVSPGCPSKLPIFKQKMLRSEKDVVQAAFERQHSQFEDAKYLHRMILNGGNTTDLKNEIQMASETWQLRNKLLLNSPNLTTDVLIEVARKGILTRAMLMEVFFANIKACQDKEFLDIIQNDIPNPISEEMADLLIGVQEPESLRKALETQIAKYNTARTELGNQIITDILTADIVIADSLRYWLAKMDSPESQYAIAESFMSEGRYAEAIGAAQQVPILYGAYKQSVEEHDDYMTIFNLKQNVFNSNRQLNELNSSELVTLRNIATSNKGSVKTLAWNLITLNIGEVKDYKFRFPADIDKRRKTAKPQLVLSQQLTNVKVYPSPANEYVIFEYNLPEEIKEATIFVTDLSGKVIFELATKNYRGILNWDTRMIAQGVYVYKMIHQGDVLSIGKLTIIK